MAESEAVNVEKAEAEVDLPDVRVGQVWESMDPRDMEDSHRRLRVIEPADSDGRVHVENLVTRRRSHIALERFVPGPSGYRRAV